MRSLVFNFRSDVSLKRQQSVLTQINTWDAISIAKCLRPDAKHDDLRLMCYAYVADNVDADAVIERLAALPEIEISGHPAQRQLV